ncbi:MAG: MotB family protein [Methylobacter sp.]|nr:MotB family protein [Methylobacter sp.]MDP2098079.1 MotB family protein [Methylobacter sp.]MDP2430077.1 MotB family protein [Methylobacter sp.]MDP3056892.1 MotB family protein [Methylobacter sp.]MDP3364387.1 MotB family protein [Methylobacter sp.]
MANKCPKCPPGAPMWLATFADLCTLLLCFFVLMLSTATQDAKKFKQVAGSMKMAFGVQNEIAEPDSPMGTSFIAQDFSPAQTEPTIINEIRQTTVQQSPTLGASLEANKQLMDIKLIEVADDAERIKELLKEEINKGQVMVETIDLSIIIRIQEKGSFDSGSAVLQPPFFEVMNKITLAVIETKGKVKVSGHTDDVPISNVLYRSNWDLSASRAVTVAQKMLDNKGIDPARIVVQGYADTQPLAENNSAENRARNRRVEVIIVADDPTSGLNQSNIDVEGAIDPDGVTP